MDKKLLRVFAAAITSVVIALLQPLAVYAWEQSTAFKTHQEINRQALALFYQLYANNNKYVNAAIDKAQYYLGPKVQSASLDASGHVVTGSVNTFEEWVIHGSYSADEPHLWASIRHFYDPLAINGVPQLTDHNWVHGQAYTAISAREWTFNDDSNPYSWKKALSYYKRSMEIGEDSKITVIPGTDFRDPELPAESLKKVREIYLAKSFRSLGETMHMLADLTQPAHVRNDSHPYYEALESNVTSDLVQQFAKSPVDPRIGNAIDNAPDLQAMYEKLAFFTNNYFYTEETIYDKDAGINPWNGEKPYPHPQFSDLTLDKLSPVKTYYAQFNGKSVPMIQQSYTSWKLGVWQSYVIPVSFAKGQAEVLLPIAIKATAKAIDQFFPTFQLSLNAERIEAQGLGDKEWKVTSEMKHLIDNDVEWKKRNLLIKYSGPAELRGERNGKSMHIADVVFKDGALKDTVFLFTGGVPGGTAVPNKYAVDGYSNIFIVINAGGRTFTSEKYDLNTKYEILNIYSDPKEPYSGSKTEFRVKTSTLVIDSSGLQGCGPFKCVWDWGDGSSSDQMNCVGTLHKYDKPGTYKITVKMVCTRDNKLISSPYSKSIDVR